jgi:hypothetical protein
MLENRQMRGILVTPDNTYQCEMFRAAHIERKDALRKRPRCGQPAAKRSVDGCGGLQQTAAKQPADEMKDL